MPYGRKGLPIAAISVVDLALWDLLGKVRGEPVYNLIGGLSRDEISFYCTGPAPDAVKALGLLGRQGAAAARPFRRRGRACAKNVDFLAAHRETVGAGLSADGRLLHVADRALRHPPRRGLQAPRHLLVGRGASPRRHRGYRVLKQAHPTTSNGRPASTNIPATASAA